VLPSTRIVDLVLRTWGRVPAPVQHNLGKSSMIKRCMWHLNVDQIDGAYVEFGVAMGHSMRSAEIAERTTHLESLGIKRVQRRLIGFDTFSSFSSDSELDAHPTWEGTSFNIDLERIRRRFKKDLNSRIFLNQQDACGLVDSNNEILVSHDSTGLEGPIALLLLDMDLYAPTVAALEWCYPRIQPGTIIFLDEYFAFGGRRDRGEALALQELQDRHPQLELRQFGFYGSGGAVFIVAAC